MRLFVRTVLAIAAAAVLTVSCQTNVYYQNELDRFDAFTSPSSVILVYGIGHNNLSSYIAGNVTTLCKNPLPQRGSDKVLLAFTSLSSKGDITWPENDKSYLVRISTSASKVYRDTLLTIEGGRKATDPDVVKEVLGYARRRFKADRYGLILSSHGSGWLPAGYIQPVTTTSWMDFTELSSGYRTTPPAERYRMRAPLSGPLTKSFGMDCFGKMEEHGSTAYELSIETLASAIEDRWDFILFDACFMGCVEVAYELKDCTDKLCLSAAEVLATGFNYAKLTRLLFNSDASAEAFCKAYFDYYNTRTGDHRTATVATVKTSEIEGLATVCKELITKYSAAVAAVDTNAVQVYSRGGKKWFCDLQDIFTQSGISQADSLKLQAALDRCISYKAATPYIIADLRVDTFCGISMYLPAVGNDVLNTAYKRTAWNKAVNLVGE
ncbi:MAG: hypothetical protein J5771_05550 [Bacteroidales bacterium]|nr:hypothetical protein [Bacteroidales bacterium]